jgi:hypothetical protein
LGGAAAPFDAELFGISTRVKFERMIYSSAREIMDLMGIVNEKVVRRR